MPELTIVIPVAPYHSHLAQNAIDSVLAQTIPCNVLTVDDKDGRGAGWARNQGLRKVNSEFVSFLDADDTLELDFAATCFDILSRVEGSRYVYTNWYEGDQIKQAPSPCDLWTMQTYHLVTTVMRTSDVRRIGGFDENMPGAEDTDFGIRLKLSGVCGVHLNAPLLHYRKGGKRSVDLRGSGQETVMLEYMRQRYRGYTMGCCGENVPPQAPQGEKVDGDVLAQAQWAGNRQERGLATGRIYPRTSFPKIVHVNPLDVAIAPHMWKKVSAVPQASTPALQPGYQAQSPNWRSASDAAFGGGTADLPTIPAQMEWDYKDVANRRGLNEKLKLAQRKTGE